MNHVAPELEGQVTEIDFYKIRDFVPDFDAIAAEFAARSRAFEARAHIRSHSYGPRSRETLDIIVPNNLAAGAPLHVFVHGGYWRSGEKTDYRFVADPVLAAGGIAALVEYDLMPGQRLPVLVDQVRRAVAWVQENAVEVGGDPARITVSGHSAGAHLSSLLAATGVAEAAPALPRLKGLLLLSGIYDLSGIPDSFLRDEAGMTHEEAAAWSPLDARHIQLPRIIAYGSDETRPFHDQAGKLAAMLHAEDHPTELLSVAGLNHMNVVLDLADPSGTLGRRLADLVASS